MNTEKRIGQLLLEMAHLCSAQLIANKESAIRISGCAEIPDNVAKDFTMSASIVSLPVSAGDEKMLHIQVQAFGNPHDALPNWGEDGKEKRDDIQGESAA